MDGDHDNDVTWKRKKKKIESITYTPIFHKSNSLNLVVFDRERLMLIGQTRQYLLYSTTRSRPAQHIRYNV